MNEKASIKVAPNGNIQIHIPIALRRKMGRKMIFTSRPIDGITQGEQSQAQLPLVQCLARAFAWTGIIESGQVRSISELARKLNVDGSYITRVMKLSTLAPDITLAILNGEEPEGLSMSKLFQPFPEDWMEQRRHFGFS
jgi:hypothetical protein